MKKNRKYPETEVSAEKSCQFHACANNILKVKKIQLFKAKTCVIFKQVGKKRIKKLV